MGRGENVTGCRRFPRRFAPRNDKSGSRHGRRCHPITCQPARRSVSAATDAIGACHFNGSLYKSSIYRREGHAPPLQRAAGNFPLSILHLSHAAPLNNKVSGSSDSISKSGRREIFWQGEVWKTQEYFVYPQGACRIRKAARPPLRRVI